MSPLDNLKSLISYRKMFLFSYNCVTWARKHTPNGVVPIPYKDIEKLYNSQHGVIHPLSNLIEWVKLRDEYLDNKGQNALRKSFLDAGMSEDAVDKMVAALIRDHEKAYNELLNADFRIPLYKLLAERGWNEEQIQGFLYGSEFGPSPTGSIWDIRMGAFALWKVWPLFASVGLVVWGFAFLCYPRVFPYEFLKKWRRELGWSFISSAALTSLISIFIVLFQIEHNHFFSGDEVFFIGVPASVWDFYVGVHVRALPISVLAVALLALVLCALRKNKR